LKRKLQRLREREFYEETSETMAGFCFVIFLVGISVGLVLRRMVISDVKQTLYLGGFKITNE
jgi:hypothetical protein